MRVSRSLGSLSVLLVSLLPASAFAGVQTAVDGGTPVLPGQLRFLVEIEGLLGGDTVWQHLCGASLIDSRTVLTARHCFIDPQSGEPYPDLDHRLVLDRADRTAPALRAIPADGYTMHVNPVRDVVVLRLHQAQPDLSVVALPVAGQWPAAGLLATLAGWGYTEQDRLPDQLLQVEVPVVAPELCDTPYQVRAQQVPLLCAGRPGRGSRSGDSGGPLFIAEGADRTVQLGVVSGGRSGYPDHYVNLADPALQTWLHALPE